ncbi:hypothetical protein Taro_049224 [Colocasia esculenta]|uniref:Uncharacterized protein n=1 Tax=Colocasia esculenta TaxID=4460 RepID=A0A843XAD9_COLES|nr:hypothetical protein [Colocasia esculenta]
MLDLFTTSAHTVMEEDSPPSVDAVRDFLERSTVAYHLMGCPRDPWMAAVDSLWSEVRRRHQEAVRHRVQELTAEIALAEQRLEALRSRRGGVVSHVESLRASHSGCHADIATLRRTLEEVSSRLAEHEAASLGLAEGVAAAEAELTAVERECADSQAALSALQASLADSRRGGALGFVWDSPHLGAVFLALFGIWDELLSPRLSLTCPIPSPVSRTGRFERCPFLFELRISGIPPDLVQHFGLALGIFCLNFAFLAFIKHLIPEFGVEAGLFGLGSTTGPGPDPGAIDHGICHLGVAYHCGTSRTVCTDLRRRTPSSSSQAGQAQPAAPTSDHLWCGLLDLRRGEQVAAGGLVDLTHGPHAAHAFFLIPCAAGSPFFLSSLVRPVRACGSPARQAGSAAVARGSSARRAGSIAVAPSGLLPLPRAQPHCAGLWISGETSRQQPADLQRGKERRKQQRLPSPYPIHSPQQASSGYLSTGKCWLSTEPSSTFLVPLIHPCPNISMAPKAKKLASRRRPSSSRAGDDDRATAERRMKLRDDCLPELVVPPRLNITHSKGTHTKFVQPRYVNFESLADLFPNLQPLFDTQEWTSFLYSHTVYSPTVVRDFFNHLGYTEGNDFYTTVKGTTFKVTANLISKALQIPNSGADILTHTPDASVYYQLLTLEDYDGTKKIAKLNANFFPPLNRMIHHIFTTMIVPKHGSRELVTDVQKSLFTFCSGVSPSISLS